MLKLYQFGPAWGIADPSPFCLKVIYWLRMAGIPYRPVTGTHQLRKSPKGKLPFIEDEGQIVGDSTFILEYLRQRHGDPLGADVGERERASAHAVGKMLEENLYWALVRTRWLDDNNWKHYTCPQFFGSMPAPIRAVVPGMLRRGIRKTIHGQGLGRHSDDEIKQLAIADLQCVSGALGDRPFMLGDAVSDVDATVAAFLMSVSVPPHPSPMRDYVTSNARLSGYLDRVMARVGEAPEQEAA